MGKKIIFDIRCPACGSDQITRPNNFDFNTNFNNVSCAKCGRAITREDALRQAKGGKPAERTNKLLAHLLKTSAGRK